MGYTPYKMNGHELKGIKQRGVPFTGGVGSREDRTGVAGSLNPSPNNFGGLSAEFGIGATLAKLKAAKKAKNGGGGDLEGRVAALEAGSGGGGGGAATAMSAEENRAKAFEATGDPMFGPAGAAPSGFTKDNKPKKKNSFAGIGLTAGNAVTAMSDIRLKEKIEKAGKSPSGIPIYMFNYIGENKRYEGAMAQDLISMGIDAVETHESGYYMVDYSKIDVDMKLIN